MVDKFLVLLLIINGDGYMLVFVGINLCVDEVVVCYFLFLGKFEDIMCQGSGIGDIN